MQGRNGRKMRRKGTEKTEEEAKIRKRKKKSITENKKIYFFCGGPGQK